MFKQLLRKHFISYTLLTLPVLFAHAQGLQAHYKVTKEMYSTTDNGITKQVATLQFDGFLYHQGGRNIFFKKPLYLAVYPDGVIHIQTSEHSQTQIGLVTDSLQGIDYIDTDSLIERQRVDIGGNHSFNTKQKLKIGRERWEILPDKKTVNGLNCQKAQWINPNGVLQWVVWFCADIPVFVGPGSITDLPGLVVEAENKIRNENYVLESYKADADLPKNAFWPMEFDQPFQ